MSETGTEPSDSIGAGITNPLFTKIQNKFWDTNRLWLFILTPFFIAIGLGLHITAEIRGWYSGTDVDVWTHFLGFLAITAIILNLNLRGRKGNWLLSASPAVITILFALITGLLWEGFEEVVAALQIFPNLTNDFWNALQDLLMDVLGAITASYLFDNFVHKKQFIED